jgi:tetratricopeptide (TPR) repeat protein
LAVHQEVGNRPGESATWDSLGFAYHQAGDYPTATACYEQALAVSRDNGDRYNEATILGHLGDSRAAAGDNAGASTSWRQSLDLMDTLGHPDADHARARLRTSGRCLAPGKLSVATARGLWTKSS